MVRKGTPRGWKSTARKGTTKGAHVEPTISTSRYTHSYLSLHPDPLPGVEMPQGEAAEPDESSG